MSISHGAALLRQIMLDRKLSQRDVEKAIEAPSTGLVAKWVTDTDPRSPSLSNAIRLRDLYGIPVEAWLDASESLPPTGTEGAA